MKESAKDRIDIFFILEKKRYAFAFCGGNWIDFDFRQNVELFAFRILLL